MNVVCHNTWPSPDPKVGNSCCRCCEAAQERGELDHALGDDCPYPPCDWCGV